MVKFFWWVGVQGAGGSFFQESPPAPLHIPLPFQNVLSHKVQAVQAARGTATAYMAYAEPDEQEKHRNATKIVQKMAQSGTNGTVWHKELG